MAKTENLKILLIDDDERFLNISQQVLEEQYGFCIVVLTGYKDLENGRRAVKEGADDYLMKPIDYDALVVKLQLAYQQQEESNRLLNQPLEQSRNAHEKEYFIALLGRNRGNIRQCAQESGLNRQYLYQKLDALNIDYDKFRPKKSID